MSKSRENNDFAFAAEGRQIVEDLIEHMRQGLSRGLVIQLSLDNGGQSGKPVLNFYRVDKKIDEYTRAPEGTPKAA